MLTVYTDGAFSRMKDEKNYGGWAWWVHDLLFRFGNATETTSNRMELQAAISALRDLAPQAKDEGGLIVYSDSLYIVNCFADRWYINWRKHGWVKTYNGQTSDIKNRDLWEDLLEIWEDYLYSGTPVSWRHIRGHGVDPNASPIHVMGNDRVDKLAVRAKKMLML